jgi:oxygen-independent coproporphyrinogen-3 oxidase
MAGIYIHIPFCKRACTYCNFHFSTSLVHQNVFVPALLKEMNLRRQYLSGEIIETVYIGGGTPSLLTNEELQTIFRGLTTEFNISPAAEITMEANPDDVTAPKLRQWKMSGINRLSIGVQSFFDEDLQWMNRAHNAVQAVESIESAFAEGFNNITIDLIFGTPILDDMRWKTSLDKAIRLNIPHLSCYALSVEPRTMLAKKIGLGQTRDIDPGHQADQFVTLMEWLGAAGYEHYEISNFAKPGYRSRHNSAYWQGKKYLGLGPSAHSYDLVSRQWNIANNALYIRAFETGELIVEKETLTQVQMLNEYIMTSLRTIEGCDLNYISEKFGSSATDQLRKCAEIHLRDSSLYMIDSMIRLTDGGKLFADGIASDLFFDSQSVQ